MSKMIVWTVLFYICIVGLVAAAAFISRMELARADFTDHEVRRLQLWTGYQDNGGNSLGRQFCKQALATQ